MKPIISMVWFTICSVRATDVVPVATTETNTNFSESSQFTEHEQNQAEPLDSIKNLRGSKANTAATTSTDHRLLPSGNVTLVVAPLPTREETMAAYINNVTKSGETFQYPWLYVPTKVEEKAIVWLVDRDPLKLNPSKTADQFRIRQRYALMLFYLQETETDKWTNATGWGTSPDECSWYGIECIWGFVVKVELNRNNLVGTIRPDVALLRYLTTLTLVGNKLSGSLPRSISNFVDMDFFNMAYNSFSGTVPDVFNYWNEIRYFSISGNNFSGILPGSIFWKRKVEYFLVARNNFTGQISYNMVNWAGAIKNIRLENNHFGGATAADRAIVPADVCPTNPSDLYLTADCTVVCSCCDYCFHD
jgi:hypothetical protein